MSFDDIIDHKNSHSAKFDSMGKATGVTADDALPMWVADMDFRPPQAVTDTLASELARGTFPYFGNDETTRSAICDWMRDQHGWTPKPGWISFSHGVVHGLGMVLEALSEPGDGVILFSPVYHAFYRQVKAKNRNVVESHLILGDNGYEMDLDALAKSLTGKEKIVIFCSPHNPGGKLWSSAEINALADFCLAHDLLLISDEVHMDLVFPGSEHLATARVAPQVAPKLVTLTAASKGFNLAGAETAFMIVQDEALRAKLAPALASFGGSPNRFGMLMLEAAFTGGHDWSRDLRAYLAENYRVFCDGVNAIPGVSVMDMSSTYLAWVDFNKTGMTEAEITERVQGRARIAVNIGSAFGTGGKNFMRFNLGTPRANVVEAVSRLQAAFSDLQ
jgi:cystathionine beta-lyase